MAELQKSKDDLTSQNETLQTEIVELNDKLITVTKKIASQEDDISQLQTRLTEVRVLLLVIFMPDTIKLVSYFKSLMHNRGNMLQRLKYT